MELFETFDSAGNAQGLVERDEVHRRGLWHRAAHVLVFRTSGALLVQQRAPDKDLYANLLDFSVGEHLRPGETFEDGALRGLSEELGLVDVPVAPYGLQTRLEHVDEAAGIRDFEVIEIFKAVTDAPITPDPVEVADVLVLDPDALRELAAAAPERFTRWFLADLSTLGLL